METIARKIADGVWIGIGITFVLAFSAIVADRLHNFNSGDIVSAAQINSNFAKMPPIGSVVAWHKDMAGLPSTTLPDGWVECNGQTLNDVESGLNGRVIPNLNGAAAGASSPGFASVERLILRGGSASGTGEMDQFQAHSHSANIPSGGAHTHYLIAGKFGPGSPSADTIERGQDLDKTEHQDVTSTGSAHSHTITIGDATDSGSGAGTPRFGGETRVKSMSVIWIMRVK